MNKKNLISIDEAKFLKISKKLLANFQKNKNQDLKLSQIQEMLATSLGYRNFNSLHSVFISNEIESNDKSQNNKKEKYIHRLTFNDIEIILSKFISSENIENELKINLNVFIPCMLRALSEFKQLNYMSDTVDLNEVTSWSSLKKVLTLYQCSVLSVETKENLKNYLSSIFLANDMEDYTIVENLDAKKHNKIFIQMIGVINKIIKIKENNVCIAKPDWFDLSLVDIGTPIFEEKEAHGLYDSLKLNTEIDEAWFNNLQYVEFVRLHFKKDIKKNLYMSDLLFYAIRVMKQDTKLKYFSLVNNLLENYTFVLNISTSLDENKK